MVLDDNVTNDIVLNFNDDAVNIASLGAKM